MSATTVLFSELSSWLQNQPQNTVNTPYELNIVNDVTWARFKEEISMILYGNSDKFVDLSETVLVLPENPTGQDLSILGMFRGCNTLVKSPILPYGVTDMTNCFQQCTNLIEAPQIPSSVLLLDGTFTSCENLTVPPLIPNGVTSMIATFANAAIINAPIFPVSVNNVTECFYGCSALVNAYVFESNVEYHILSLFELFRDCVSLVNVSDIPNGVTSIEEAFYNCQSLVVTPLIPDTVNNIVAAFEECYALTTVTNLPNCITDMSHTFGGCHSLINIPALPEHLINLTSTFANCYNLTNAPNIPESVTNMNATFDGCSSLVESPVIPRNVTDFRHTFSYCSSLTTITFEYFDLSKIEEYEFIFFMDRGVLNNFYAPNPYELKMFLKSLEGHDKPTYGWDIDNANFYLYPIDTPVDIPLATLNNELSVLKANTTSTPYEINVTGITSNNFGDIKTALLANNTKYVNLGATQIPDTITDLSNSFEGCSTLIVSPQISDVVTDLTETFKNCSNLEEVPSFGVPMSVLENNAADCFSGCTNLTTIGVPAPVVEADEWHVFLLDIGEDSISGRVYDNEGNYETISSTQITKDKLTLPIMTDELLFTSQTSVSDLIDLIEDVIENGYSYFSGTCISPDNKTMVLYADDPNNFISNIPMGTDVKANPQGSATDTLNKLEVEGTVYSVSEVEGNTGETPSQPITDISIDGTVYSIPEVVGNSGETPSQPLSDLKIDGTVYSIPEVEGNTGETPLQTLSDLKIDGTVYSVGSKPEVIYKDEDINHNNSSTKTMSGVSLQANSVYLFQMAGALVYSGRTGDIKMNIPNIFGVTGTYSETLAGTNSFASISTKLIRTTSAITHTPTVQTPNGGVGYITYQRLYIKIG